MNYKVQTSNRFASLNSDDEAEQVKVSAQVRGGQKRTVDVKQTDRSERAGPHVQKNITDDAASGQKKQPSKRSQAKPQKQMLIAEEYNDTQEKNEALLGQNTSEMVTNEAEESSYELVERHKDSKQRRRFPHKGRVSREKMLTETKGHIKRIYDRHSGTGRGKEIKRHGAGPHNWGNTTDIQQYSVEKGDSSDFAKNGADSSGEIEDTDGNVNTGDSNNTKPPRHTNYSEYQKKVQQRRDQWLNQEQETQQSHPVPNTEHDLEKEGYQKYRKKDNANDRSRPPRKNKNFNDDINNGAHEDGSSRQTKYNINELNGRSFQRFPRKGRNGQRSNQKGTDEESAEETQKPTPCYPVSLDLRDQSAFPTLA